MATKRVNIDIVAKDKSQQALNKVRGSLDKVRASVFNVRNALVGLGAGLAIRSLVKTGIEIESLQVRLKFLFGSVEEGAKAFDEMAKFAARVPFSLEQIQAGSGNLAVVAKDAEELSDLLEITGNVAAATGLDFQTTAEQIQRSFSAGIGAADLFRDRGVRAMLGFQAGATVSIDETVKRFEEVFGAGGEFGGTTKALAQTLEGTLSMIGDSFFKFKKDILDAGFFPELKRQFGDLDKFLKDNEDQITETAKLIGENLAGALQKIVSFGKVAANNLELFGVALLGVVTVLSPQIGAITALGVAIGVLADKFQDAKLAAIGINEEFKNLEFFELMDKVEDLNKQLEKNKDKLIQLKDEGPFDILGIDQHDAVIKAYEEENALIHKQIAIAKRLIKEKLDLGDAIQVQTLSVKSLMEAEAEAMKKSLEANQKRADMNKRIAQAEANEKVRINKMGLEEIQKNTRDSLQAVSGLNRTAFEAYKRFQIAEASINAIRAASKAFGQYPFPLNLAVSASALAKGMALVAQIKSTNFRAGGGSVNKDQAYMVGEKGPEMFVPSGSGKIIPNNQMGSGQPVTVNFNINTVDARGFNELLTNSRGVIVNMINSAVNETGRQAIV
tara:strand:+ start:2814 stop:4658 length:1845 start_codon:yes stop_codon:yes gene_type:complete